MKNHLHLLQLDLFFADYKTGLLAFITAFIVTLIAIPPIIALVKKFRLYDMPDCRKEHSIPIPTLGGIAIVGGMMASLLLWFPFTNSTEQVSFFFLPGCPVWRGNHG